MISSPRANFYVSDEGFSVEVLGRTGLRYREGGREVFVDSEVLVGESGMMVYKFSIERWKTPSAELAITDVERERIVDNIRKVFRAQDFEIDVI